MGGISLRRAWERCSWKGAHARCRRGPGRLRGEHREPFEAGDALLRCPHGRQYDWIGVAEVGPEALLADDPRAAQGEERADLQLTLTELHPGVALEDLEGRARRG